MEIYVVYDVSYTTEFHEMPLRLYFALAGVWTVWGIVWLVAAAFAKRTVRSQAMTQRLPLATMTFSSGVLLGSGWFRHSWLALRFVPELSWVEATGLALAALGCGFSVWARLTLGANWSGRVTVKADHELIVSGPYALTRHPIYTGILIGVAGTALAIGEWRCVVAFFLLLIAFLLKIRVEEQLMTQTFPATYPEYRRRVKALVPWLF
ncbi:MAG TPA: isoprenylcysteine carboxylmethyltransferase family protein [Terracidiphilus sp.]|nr:isoprenylcysteine carboxylmethyltransferase family protein [Terracidiphilus sp.]